jgi:hypothetical protein
LSRSAVTRSANCGRKLEPDAFTPVRSVAETERTVTARRAAMFCSSREHLGLHRQPHLSRISPLFSLGAIMTERYLSIVDVHVILRRKGTILLLRRAGNVYATGMLCLPSVHLASRLSELLLSDLLLAV